MTRGPQHHVQRQLQVPAGATMATEDGCQQLTEQAAAVREAVERLLDEGLPGADERVLFKPLPLQAVQRTFRIHSRE